MEFVLFLNFVQTVFIIYKIIQFQLIYFITILIPPDVVLYRKQMVN